MQQSRPALAVHWARQVRLPSPTHRAGRRQQALEAGSRQKQRAEHGRSVSSGLSPGGPKGTDFGNGESQYTAGPYVAGLRVLRAPGSPTKSPKDAGATEEFLSVETRRLCERSCSERSWCGDLGVCGPSFLQRAPFPDPPKLLFVLSAGAGYAFKHSKSQGRLPDWRLGACQLARALAPHSALLAACGRLREVGKRIVTATQVPQVASFGKASCSVAGIVSLTR